ncbi:hypothetical protein N879_14725 [Alcaligenes sp. EGD-AK7]|nr:hypothetical protein N879_14725 [Alcaligenes sp. EGD-AK7]
MDKKTPQPLDVNPAIGVVATQEQLSRCGGMALFKLQAKRRKAALPASV